MLPRCIARWLLLCSWLVLISAAADQCEGMRDLNTSLPEGTQLQYVHACPQQGLRLLTAIWKRYKVEVKCSAPSYCIFTSRTAEALISRSGKPFTCCDQDLGLEKPCIRSFKLSAMRDWYLAAASSANGSFIPVYTSESPSRVGQVSQVASCSIAITMEPNILGNAVRILLSIVKWCSLFCVVLALAIIGAHFDDWWLTWPLSGLLGFGMARTVTAVWRLCGAWLVELPLMSPGKHFLPYLGVAVALRGAMVYWMNRGRRPKVPEHLYDVDEDLWPDAETKERYHNKLHGKRLLVVGLSMIYLGFSNALQALTVLPGILPWAACGVLMDTVLDTFSLASHEKKPSRPRYWPSKHCPRKKILDTKRVKLDEDGGPSQRTRSRT